MGLPARSRYNINVLQLIYVVFVTRISNKHGDNFAFTLTVNWLLKLAHNPVDYSNNRDSASVCKLV
jgi:hypothetical protein